jgi:hypothetical protein
MSKIEVNQIGPQCGTTLTVGCGAGQTVNIDANTVTLGRCGATVSLAAGATQTGFGRTGTVDWDTTAKTASFNAVSGNGYFVNTTSAAVTMTLPATPSAGDIVSVKDYAGTFGTNNLTIARNGSNLDGNAGDKVVSTNFQNFTMVYVDGTQGWIATGSGTDTIGILPVFVTATGGTITTCDNYKIHTFTGPGTFCVSCGGNPFGSDSVDYLVIAGGASGGGGTDGAGGGGAGGYRFSDGTASGCYTAGPSPLGASALPVTAQGYPITVGAGGSGNPYGPYNTPLGSGSNSIFSTITSTGGGDGGLGNNSGPSNPVSVNANGIPGGSGGGGGTFAPGTPGQGTVGSGNTPPVSPPQGNPGGTGATDNGSYRVGGGGGGAGGTGVNVCDPAPAGGVGGAGLASSITGLPVTRAGGGGGGGHPHGEPGGAGGSGGGGVGATPTAAGAGTTNTGSGGGGGAVTFPAGAGAGGSGIVIIRYKFQ